MSATAWWMGKATTARLAEEAAAAAALAAESGVPLDAQLARETKAEADRAAPSAPLFLLLEEFKALCGGSVEYVYPPYLVKSGLLIIGGAPKGGKTWFAAWLAAEIERAGYVVMFVEEEGSMETMAERVKPFAQEGARIYIAHRKGFRLDDERSVARLIEEVKATGAGVLFLDPLNLLHSHMRAQGEIPAEVLQGIKRIIDETGCAVVLLHHTRKGASWDKNDDGEAQSADLAGSLGWVGSADNIVQIKGVPTKDRQPGEVRFYVENPDTRNGEPFTRKLAVVRPGAYSPDAMTFVAPESGALLELLPLIPEGAENAAPIDSIREKSGKGSKAVREAVALGVRTGRVQKRAKGGGIYRLPVAE